MTRLRIVVAGLAVSYPLGGMFWHYLQYAIGLTRLGHDVLYLEDTGRWAYDPTVASFVEDGSHGIEALQRALTRIEPVLARCWAYRDARGRMHGRSHAEVVAFCRDADLLFNISASLWLREEYALARRLVLLDSDPMYTQAADAGYLAGAVDAATRARIEAMRRHHVFFTLGENVGRAGCRIPTALFPWRPTRQPVLLDQFAPGCVAEAPRPVLTSVLSWDAARGGLVVDGVVYGGKAVEFERFMDLPSRSALPLELAIGGGDPPTGRLQAHGWQVVDGWTASRDPEAYRCYLGTSAGELGIAKQAYVTSGSGWFSERTACYLALGVPAVVQDTGWTANLPSGEGLIAFRTPEEALDGIARIAREPERHRRAARRIAEAEFDAAAILPALLAEALAV